MSLNLFYLGFLRASFYRGGGGGQFDPPIWPPLQILGPKGPIAEKCCMDVTKHLNEYCYDFFFAKNGLFIIVCMIYGN